MCIFKLFKRKDTRTSSLDLDSFIRSVEIYIEDKPDIRYDESIKEMLIDWYINHEDNKINAYLNRR